MAKVELIVNNKDNPFLPTGYAAALDALPTRSPVTPEHDEYADKVWDEFVIFNLIEELVGKRKVVQRKLDAARKRFKRLTAKLNIIEKQWATV